MSRAVALLSLLATAPAYADPVGVTFHGNVVLPDDVYLAVIGPAPEKAEERHAGAVAEKVLAFLHRAGYELARVRALAQDGEIQVQINEGRLEKVVFRGRLNLKSLRLKLALSIPHDVFNRPSLDRQLRRLARTLDVQHFGYELVPTQEVHHLGPQLENLGSIKGQAIVRPREPYELHLFLGDPEWDTGAGLDLRSDYFDGLELGLNYQGASLLFRGDRWRVGLSGGGGLRERISDALLYPAFTRATAEATWYAPAVFLRPFVALRGEGLSRQRVDLGLESYVDLLAEGSLNLQYELGPARTLSIGLGGRYTRLFAFNPSPGWTLPPSVAELERIRTFARLRTDLVFQADAQRWDRRHALALEGRHFFAIRDPHFGEAHLSYQRVFDLGWHDLWIRARGAWLWGEVPFHDEPQLASHLRGVFGDTYVRRLASASLEFRFSITRDLYKLSLFHDLAVFGELDRAASVEHGRIGDSFGAGFHALIEGMLQLDLYVSFGFTSARRFDSGFTVVLQKVF